MKCVTKADRYWQKQNIRVGKNFRDYLILFIPLIDEETDAHQIKWPAQAQILAKLAPDISV